MKLTKRQPLSSNVPKSNTINQRLPHPDGICDSCSSAKATCELSGPGHTTCDRCQARKEKCSLSRARESKKGESSKKVRPKKTVKDIGVGKPPSKGAKTTGSHLLADNMTVFSNPHLKGASPIPPKSIRQLAETAGESEPIIQMMRSQVDIDTQANWRSSESVRQGSVRPGHDQEIPKKPFLSFLGTSLTCHRSLTFDFCWRTIHFPATNIRSLHRLAKLLAQPVVVQGFPDSFRTVGCLSSLVEVFPEPFNLWGA